MFISTTVVLSRTKQICGVAHSGHTAALLLHCGPRDYFHFLVL